MIPVTDKREESGFTLIELIVVISIIAILAVVALPRFADLTEDAHRSNVEGTFGAFSVAVNLVHAQWITKGKPSNTDDLPGFGAQDVNVGDEGWPVGTTGPDNSTVMSVIRCIEIWDGILIDQAPTVGTSVDMDYGVTLGDTLNECRYTYQGGGAEYRSITYNALTGDVYRINP